MSDLGVPLVTAGATISASDADELVATGDWVPSRNLIEEIKRAFKGFVSKLPAEAGSGPVDMFRLTDAWSGADAMLREYEHCEISSPGPAWHQTEVRLGPAYVLKIGPTLRAVVPKAIAFALFIVGAAKVNGVFYGGAALHGYELMKILKSAWERIQDPDERVVFEAVAELSARITIVKLRRPRAPCDCRGVRTPCP